MKTTEAKNIIKSFSNQIQKYLGAKDFNIENPTENQFKANINNFGDYLQITNKNGKWEVNIFNKNQEPYEVIEDVNLRATLDILERILNKEIPL